MIHFDPKQNWVYATARTLVIEACTGEVLARAGERVVLWHPQREGKVRLLWPRQRRHAWVEAWAFKEVSLLP